MTGLQVVLSLLSGLGTAAILGLWRLLARVLRVVHRVEAQMQNNGGKSLRDAVDRIEHRQKRISKRVSRLEQKASE